MSERFLISFPQFWASPSLGGDLKVPGTGPVSLPNRNIAFETMPFQKEDI